MGKLREDFQRAIAQTQAGKSTASGINRTGKTEQIIAEFLKAAGEYSSVLRRKYYDADRENFNDKVSGELYIDIAIAETSNLTFIAAVPFIWNYLKDNFLKKVSLRDLDTAVIDHLRNQKMAVKKDSMAWQYNLNFKNKGSTPKTRADAKAYCQINMDVEISLVVQDKTDLPKCLFEVKGDSSYMSGVSMMFSQINTLAGIINKNSNEFKENHVRDSSIAYVMRFEDADMDSLWKASGRIV